MLGPLGVSVLHPRPEQNRLFFFKGCIWEWCTLGLNNGSFQDRSEGARHKAGRYRTTGWLYGPNILSLVVSFWLTVTDDGGRGRLLEKALLTWLSSSVKWQRNTLGVNGKSCKRKPQSSCEKPPRCALTCLRWADCHCCHCCWDWL